MAVTAADALARQVEWLLRVIQGQSELRSGWKVEMGWSTLSLRQEGDELVICEPSYDSDPFTELRDDISCTLTVLAQQRDVLAAVGEEGKSVQFYSKVVLASGSLELERVYLERSETDDPRDSGWCIGPADEGVEHGSYEAVYLYQLLHLRPALMRVLLLPPG